MPSNARTAFPLPLASMSRWQDTCRSAAPEQRDGVRGQALAATRVAEPVGRRRPDVDLAGADRLLEAAAHRLAVRGDPRLLADEHAVGVDELEARSRHLRIGLREQLERRDAAQRLVVGGKERADVA